LRLDVFTQGGVFTQQRVFVCPVVVTLIRKARGTGG